MRLHPIVMLFAMPVFAVGFVMGAAPDAKSPEAPKTKLEAVKPVDLTGWYAVVGQENGKRYETLASVFAVPGRGDVYLVSYMTKTGAVTQAMMFRVNDTKYVSNWQYIVEGKLYRGVTIYDYSHKEQGFIGRWNVVPGPGRWNEETMIFHKHHEKTADDEE